MTVYATSRRLTTSGDYQWSSTGFAVSPSPAASAVLFVLRTRQGECLAAPELGVPWPTKLGTNAEGSVRAAILAGLAGLVRRGTIDRVEVQVDEQPGGTIAFEVSFDDVRARTRETVRGVR